MGLCGDDLVEMDDVGVVEAAVVVELAGEVGGEGFGDFFDGCAGAGEPVGGEMDGAIGACGGSARGGGGGRGDTLADDPAEGVVADYAYVFRAEFVGEFMVCGRELGGGKRE